MEIQNDGFGKLAVISTSCVVTVIVIFVLSSGDVLHKEATELRQTF